MSKVKPLKIKSEFSEPEKVSLLHDRKVTDGSVSVLPLIWTQIDKHNSSVNKIHHFY